MRSAFDCKTDTESQQRKITKLTLEGFEELIRKEVGWGKFYIKVNASDLTEPVQDELKKLGFVINLPANNIAGFPEGDAYISWKHPNIPVPTRRLNA